MNLLQKLALYRASKDPENADKYLFSRKVRAQVHQGFSTIEEKALEGEKPANLEVYADEMNNLIKALPLEYQERLSQWGRNKTKDIARHVYICRYIKDFFDSSKEDKAQFIQPSEKPNVKALVKDGENIYIRTINYQKIEIVQGKGFVQYIPHGRKTEDSPRMPAKDYKELARQLIPHRDDFWIMLIEVPGSMTDKEKDSSISLTFLNHFGDSFLEKK